MSQFEAVVRAPGGAIQRLVLTADNEADARRLAGANGSGVLDFRPLPGRRASWAPAARRRTPLDATTFAREMASLVGAGLPVPQALQTLAASHRSAAARRVLTDLSGALAQGLRLSDAMQRALPAFPPLLVATARASEHTGDLEASFARYAEHQQNFKQLRDKVVGAAIYPALLLSLGALVVLFLLGVVVPRFATLIESSRHDVPWSSQLLLGFGRFVAEHGHATALTALALFGVAAFGVRHLLVQGAQAAWLARLPLVAGLVREFQLSQLFRTVGLLVKGGTPLPRALALCSSLLSVVERVRLTSCITAIEQGQPLARSFEVNGLADPATAGMLTVAERTGSLGTMLDRIAQFKESRLQRAVEWTSRLVEPVLMIVIGLVIGGIVVLMYLPIFDLASSLQ